MVTVVQMLLLAWFVKRQEFKFLNWTTPSQSLFYPEGLNELPGCVLYALIWTNSRKSDTLFNSFTTKGHKPRLTAYWYSVCRRTEMPLWSKMNLLCNWMTDLELQPLLEQKSSYATIHERRKSTLFTVRHSIGIKIDKYELFSRVQACILNSFTRCYAWTHPSDKLSRPFLLLFPTCEIQSIFCHLKNLLFWDKWQKAAQK